MLRRRLCSSGRYKIDALFDTVWTLAISEGELGDAGFSAGMFRNLNTPEELAAARDGVSG